MEVSVPALLNILLWVSCPLAYLYVNLVRGKATGLTRSLSIYVFVEGTKYLLPQDQIISLLHIRIIFIK